MLWRALRRPTSPSRLHDPVNQERPNERRAKQIVEKVLGVTLEHADTNGGADYLSPDGTVALEVTRVTDEDVRKGLRAWCESDKRQVAGPSLRNCWLVIVSETTPGLKTRRQRVQPLVAELESEGLDGFIDQRAGLSVLQGSEHSELYKKLLRMGVKRASQVPHARDPGPEHVHRVFVSPGGGGSASGSDESVALLGDALSVKDDNAKKLSASGAEQRHVFVWIDNGTPFAIARALSHEPPAWDDASDSGLGLPSMAPQLDGAITHLWVVHERSSRGWLWDGQTWTALEELGSGSQ